MGLLAVAAPVIIHLLGLGRSPTQRFPTLRFFSATRLAPTRRTQLHDPWLLLLRVAIFMAAVAALAQPLYRSDDRERAYASSLARVVVLDTSLSVRRAGTAALDSARRLATNLVAEADLGLVLETASPARMLDGASVWLAMQQQRRELVVLSDFQRGTLDSASLARVPVETGVRLVRISSGALQLPIALEHRVGDRLVRSLTSRSDSVGTQVSWSSRALVDSAQTAVVRVLAGEDERAAATAANDASSVIGAQIVSLQDARLASDRVGTPEIVIVTLRAPQRAALLASTNTPSEAWMLRAVSSLQSDAVLQEVARGEDMRIADDSVAGVVVAYTADAQPVVWAAAVELDGRTALLIVSNVDAGSVVMPALIAASRTVMSPQPDAAELEADQLSDSVLTSLSRAPATEMRGGVLAASPNAGDNESDGRWLWLLALVLIGAEWLLRRRMHARHSESVVT